ncbi:hypothetical protein DERP_003868 [Dermatophagoides pteronyssinus]|uniref:Uncharacterized protein n=1 Tax=Dermatophagoides pteronyssinus TaxID=6956 RepID=A0ABQ8J7I5_DERPT|nr:hypothetical protein DERP_003868 [Dermatophagoides pteronyssinus]
MIFVLFAGNVIVAETEPVDGVLVPILRSNLRFNCVNVANNDNINGICSFIECGYSARQRRIICPLDNSVHTTTLNIVCGNANNIDIIHINNIHIFIRILLIECVI